MPATPPTHTHTAGTRLPLLTTPCSSTPTTAFAPQKMPKKTKAENTDGFGFGDLVEAPVVQTGSSSEAIVEDADVAAVTKEPKEDGKIEAWRKSKIPAEHEGIAKYLYFECGKSSFLPHQVRHLVHGSTRAHARGT